ncbi:MAG: pseudouridine synthase [Methanolinea sp.]|nr:pseudouridine synthase [Methanolinea sp.]
MQRVRVIADFQFGRGVGEGLFPQDCEFILSRTGRIRQVLWQGTRLATLRASDGRLTLGMAGAIRLHHILPPPAYRVSILSEVAEFILKGKNTFCKHVVSADQGIRSGDEVLVITGDDELLATGMAVLSGPEILVFNYGVAVKVRQGRSAYDAGKYQPQEDEADDEAAGDAGRAD